MQDRDKPKIINIISNRFLRNNPFKSRIIAEQLNALYKNLIFAIPANFICATLIMIILHRASHTNDIMLWFLAMFIISFIRLGIVIYYQHLKKNLNLFIALAIIHAVIWGTTSLIVIPNTSNIIEQAVIIIICAGVATGSVQALQPFFLTSASFVSLVLLPLSVWAFTQGHFLYSILGTSLLCLHGFLILISWHASWQITRLMTLQYENISLVEDLYVSYKQVQKTNISLEEKEASLKQIQDNAPIGMAIVSLDGKWLQVNNELVKLVGYSKDEMYNLTFQDITYPEDLKTDLAYLKRLIDREIQTYQMEKRYIHKKGHIIWILLSVSLIRDNDGQPLYFISQIQDINDRKRNEARIAELNKMNEMLQVCYQSSEAYPIISHAAAQLFPDFYGSLSIVSEDSNLQQVVEHWGSQYINNDTFKSNDCWSLRVGNVYIVDDPNKEIICPHFNRKPSGASICLPLIVKNQVIGILNFSSNTELFLAENKLQLMMTFSEVVKLSLANIKLHEELKAQAIHDPLTGLKNRRYLNDTLQRVLSKCNREKECLCVCILDIDYFKKINDSYGHEAGDEVLRITSTLLKDYFRGSDITCRYGGEEFVVVLPNTNMENAMQRLDLFRQLFSNTHMYAKENRLSQITLSVGIATNWNFSETVDELFHNADTALYKAKASGRNKIIAFESHTTQEI